MQTFYPGVYFKEVEFGGSARTIDGVDMSVGAIVGYFEKGPINTPVKVTASTYQSIFGGPISGGFGWYSLDGFFKNNPNGQMYVVRVAHYTNVSDAATLTAIASSVTIKDRATPTAKDSIKVTANSKGDWGNSVSVGIANGYLVDTTTMETAAINATKMKLKSITGVSVGTVLFVGTTPAMVTVSDVNPVTREVAFTPALTAELTTGSVVRSSEFNLMVYLKGELVETFKGLSINQLSPNYVETVVNDDANGSKYIVVDELGSTSAFPTNIPAVVAKVSLTGGNSGLTGVVDSDLVGVKANRTGFYALDLVQEPFNLVCPESCSEVVKRALYQYAEGRMDVFGVGSIPEGYSPEMAIAYRNETGNFNTSYGALYYKWGYVNDPIGNGVNPQKLVPLDGHIIGYYGRNDRKYDIGQVPAGEDAVLFGVNKLEGDIDDITNGDLNKVNINCIRNLSGAGIVIWGARTLSADTKWRYINARRIFIYVETSVAKGTRFAVFKPAIPSTWKTIKRTVESFMNTVPGLYGASSAERYTVICDETTNPEDIRKAGQIVTKIGMCIASVGEFVIFEIGQMSEGVSITE